MTVISEKFRRYLLIPILLALFLIFSCEADTVQPQKPEMIETKLPTADVSITILHEETKSLESEPAPDPNTPIASGHDGKYDKFLLTTRFLSNAPDDIAGIAGVMTDRVIDRSHSGPVANVSIGKMTQGEWEFSVKAVNADGDVLYTGSHRTYISTSQKTNSIALYLNEYSSGSNAMLKFDLISLGIADPRLVISMAKQGTGTDFSVVIDSVEDPRGMQTVDMGNGYCRYYLENYLMPSTGAYKLKIELYSGNESFAGTILDTWAMENRTIPVTGAFDVTGDAAFVRIEPNDYVSFTDSAKNVEIPADKIVTGFIVLGTGESVDFPYTNSTGELIYLLPVFENFSDYFSVSGSVLTSAAPAKVSSLKYLGLPYAYSGCPVSLADSLFENGALAAIYGHDIKSVGKKTFANSKLSDCVLGTLESIGQWAFSFTSVKQYSSLSDFCTFGDGAFQGAGLTDFAVPKYATMGTGVFRGCTDLAKVQYGISAIPASTFSGCTKLEEVTVSGLTEIGNEAFLGCSSLKVLDTHDLVTIGSSAFKQSGLEGTMILNSCITTIGADAFASMGNISEIYIDRIKGELSGHPWGMNPESKITYKGYKLYFNGNITTPDGPDDVVVFPRITEKNGIALPGIGIEDPLYRIVGYNRAIGDTVDGYPIPIPTRDGYGFKGWYSKPTALKDDLVGQLTLNKTKNDWTVYAGWIKGVLTLVFNPGKNSNDENGTTSEFYRVVRFNENYGRKAGDEPEEDINPSPLPDASQTKVPGRTFLGWYLSPEPWLSNGYPDEATQQKMTADLITNDRVVANKKGHVAYAHYRDHRYTLTFKTNFSSLDGTISIGKKSVSDSTYPKINGGTVKFNYPLSTRWSAQAASSSYQGSTGNLLPDLNASGFALDYYYHYGWYYDAALTQKASSGDKVKALASDGQALNLYARWTGREVPVTFKSVEYYPVFVSGNSWSNDVRTRNIGDNNGLVYFRYRSTYGKRPSTADFKEDMYDRSVALPAPTRAGYTFSGWYSSYSVDNSQDLAYKKCVFPATAVTESTVVSNATEHILYAKWTPNKYTVTFDAKGGSVPTASTVVTFNDRYPTLPVPTRAGYLFAGWYLTDDRTMGYGYTNSENVNYITAGDVVTTASNHKLYAAWVSVAITYPNKANYSDSNLKISQTLNIDPQANGYYGTGGATTNAGSVSASFKAYAYPTRKGVSSVDGAGNRTWTDAAALDEVSTSGLTYTVTRTGGQDNSLNVSVSGSSFTVSTTASSVPKTSEYTVKTNYHGNLQEAATFTVNCRGALKSISLSGSTSVYATHKVNYTAALSAEATGVPTHYTHRNVTFSVTNNDGYDSIGDNGETSKTYTSSTGQITFPVQWGYEINTRMLKAVAQINSSISATLSVEITQPAGTTMVDVNATPEFISMAKSIYSANSTAKTSWVITDFKVYYNGTTTAVSDFEVKNTSGHKIYYYPDYTVVSSAAFTQTVNTKFLAIPDKGSAEFTLGSGGENFKNVRKFYFSSKINVAAYAFRYNTSLVKVEKGGSGVLNYVGVNAFEGCTNLTMTDNGLNLRKAVTVEAGAFKNCSKLGNGSYDGGGVVLESVSGLGSYAFEGTNITSLVISTSCTVPAYVAYNTTTLKTVNVNSHTIADNAFRGLNSITDVTMNYVKTIGSYAFYGSGSFSTVTFPGSLTSIGNNAFQGLTGLTCYITIPSGCTSLGADAFNGSGISGCTVPNSVSSIGMRAFANCKKLTTANLSCPRTSGDMFESCEALTNLTLNYGVKTIGCDNSQGTFEYCTALTSVKFPSSLTSIESYGFWNCTSLTTVDFLSVGDNFNNLSFGSSVWSSCKLRHVRVSRGNFGSGSYVIKECSSGGGEGGSSHSCAGDSTIYYMKYSAAYLKAYSEGGHGGWFNWGWDDEAWSTVRYWDKYPGNTYDEQSIRCTTLEKSYSGLEISCYVGCTDGSWEYSSCKLVVYQLNTSEANSAWEYVKQKDYKFCGAGSRIYKENDAYNTSEYCNAYVYPGKLDNLMAIS